jgi:hypothetical protein
MGIVLWIALVIVVAVVAALFCSHPRRKTISQYVWVAKWQLNNGKSGEMSLDTGDLQKAWNTVRKDLMWRGIVNRDGLDIEAV